MPIDVQSFFRPRLVDMGEMNPAFRGLYVPEPEIGKAKIGVTSQFLEEAETYARKFAAVDYFRDLIDKALRRIGPLPADAVVLDIGSGSGNSVIPCLELLPRSTIVATDISENLLRILVRHVGESSANSGRIVPVCMDASNSDYYCPERFDLVIGAAILHHLINPAAAIEAAGKALARGGFAVFFEPFENGLAILRLAYEEILRRDENAQELGPAVTHLLAALNYDFATRAGTNKEAEIFQRIDDKWLFTKSYLEARAKEAGFREVEIYPITDIDEPFTKQTVTFLQVGAELSPSALPRWAWDVLEHYDDAFSRELKIDLLIEGCVILRK